MTDPTPALPASPVTPQTSAQAAADNTLEELGVTGLKRSGGIITEEALSKLQGQRGVKVYAEMGNDPMIGGVLLAMNEVIGRLDWHIQPPEHATPEEQAQADFVQQCMDDMSDSWDVVLGNIMSMVQYGWSFVETAYKRRGGNTNDPTTRSAFSDGRIGWKSWPLRSQDSLLEWAFDDAGTTTAMIQQDIAGQSRGPSRRILPMKRGLLFRTDEYKGNPEGRSMLRAAYRPWFYQKRIEEIEAIGIERDLAGMPYAYAPSDWFATNGDKRLTDVRDMLVNTRRNELDGVLLPSIFDNQNNRMLEFGLLSSGGTRQFDTNAIVGRYNNKIATSMLMDFMTLGHEDTGSYALGTAKITMWQLVVESIAKSITSAVNRHAIPRLMRLNGWAPDRTPELSFGDVAQADLTVLATFLGTMIDKGVIVPDAALEGYVRDLAHLPTSDLPEEEAAEQPGAPVVTNPAAPVPEAGGPTPAAPAEAPTPEPTGDAA